MQDLAQLVMNSIGAIAGVALTFYFLMPLFKSQLEQVRALTESIVQHELRAESRNLALLEKMDNMQNQHIESFKSLRVELAESKKVAQDIYTFNLGRYKKGEAMGGVTE